MRWPLTRTWPDAASVAAAERVRTTRGCHNHLSMRWRSKAGVPSARLLAARLELLFELCQLGKGGIGIGAAITLASSLLSALYVLRPQGGIALRSIVASLPSGPFALAWLRRRIRTAHALVTA